MNIQFNDLSKQWHEIKEVALPDVLKVLESGHYIGGSIVAEFENSFANYTNSQFAVGVSNGTDGLKLAINAIMKSTNCLVLIPANTFIAAPIAVRSQIEGSYTIKLVDVDSYFLMDLNKLENLLIAYRKSFTNAIIIATHLYGQQMDMIELSKIAKKFDCSILEDASQAHGSIGHHKQPGSFSEACVYSLYPGKSLGAAGDAGIITTNRKDIFERLLSLRNYGSDKKYHYDRIGFNFRLDAIQAVILSHKLRKLDAWNSRKNDIAAAYKSGLSSHKSIKLPNIAPWNQLHVYHIFCIITDNRMSLVEHLNRRGVPTLIHYPIPIQNTIPFQYLDNELEMNEVTKEFSSRILSLPIHPYLTKDEIQYIISSVREWNQAD
jgi:dTDP-4-amino-4,6-dideoxygalactose transaminase